MEGEQPNRPVFPARDGVEMPALVQAKDWSKTPLGAMDTWPPALRLSLDIVLSSGFPMALRWGPEFVLIYNDGYKPILGVKHPWALGLPAREVWAEVWDQIEPTHLAVLSGRQGAAFAEDLPLRLKRYGDEWDDGYFTFSYSPIPDPTAPSGVGGILITAVETTEAVKSKARASEERDRLWTLSEDMLARADYSGNMSAVNPAWTKVLGWSEHDLLTNPYADIINPEDVGATVAALQVMGATGQPTRFENRILSKDGVWKPIGWTVSPEPDGVNFIAVGRDLADYKAREAELLRTQEALRQSQKMEAIGQLTGGIAHDFNNMLAIVIGGIDLATRRLKRGEAGAEQMLEGAREGATRAATLTQRLLAFSRQSPLSPERLNINDIVAGMSDLLRRTLGEPVAFEAVLAGGLWRCSVDRAGLESAIINLALNARDAMPSGGKLTVETCNMFLDERYANRELGVAPGQYVMVAVTDVGVGMTHDVIEKAFDPFFTTKPVGKGTGLGLSMVYGFAKQSGGHVRIYSEAGRGTTVKIYLPRHFGSTEEEVVVTQAQSLNPTMGGETVLVVEDEEGVRRMSCEALKDLGYRVYEASSGEEALKVYDAVGTVDVVFTDIVMSGMTGREMADLLRQKTPGLKVLYTTGYTRNAVVHNGVLDHGVALLTKPFTIEDLALKLRAVLESA
ncbi:MAG TPA: response regulator [Hyphomonadaceae bacterium]|mgnify:FL=1|nr:response regulator [Hyphomonadaceae bacterium]